MKLPRRQFLHLAAGAAALPAVSRIARAQTYPSRPITMVVPVAAGGLQDVFGRVLAEPMRRSLGQPIVIENISGAEGSIAAGRAAHARPDGYTVELGARSTHVLNGAFYSLPYDVLSDFVPISPLCTYSFILFARKTLPAEDMNELIAWLKANQGKASAGIGAAGFRLLTALLQKEIRGQFTLVPYRGEAPASQDLVAGRIDLLFASPVQLPLLRSGMIKALAVTSESRLAVALDVATFREVGLESLSYSNWFGLFAPKGTPPGIVNKLNVAVVEALADPTVRSRLADLGMETFPRQQQSPDALGAIVKADAAKWWPIIKELGLNAE